MWPHPRPDMSLDIERLVPVVEHAQVLSIALDIDKTPKFNYFDDELNNLPIVSLPGLEPLATAQWPKLEMIRLVSPTVLIFHPLGLSAHTFVCFNRLHHLHWPAPHLHNMPWIGPFWRATFPTRDGGGSRFVYNVLVPASHGAWEEDARIVTSSMGRHSPDMVDLVIRFAPTSYEAPVDVTLHQEDSMRVWLGIVRRKPLPMYLNCGMAFALLDVVAACLLANVQKSITLVGIGHLAERAPRCLGFHPPMTYGDTQIVNRFLQGVGEYLALGYSGRCGPPIEPVPQEEIPELLSRVVFLTEEEYRNGISPRQYLLETRE